MVKRLDLFTTKHLHGTQRKPFSRQLKQNTREYCLLFIDTFFKYQRRIFDQLYNESIYIHIITNIHI